MMGYTAVNIVDEGKNFKNEASQVGKNVFSIIMLCLLSPWTFPFFQEENLFSTLSSQSTCH